MEMASGFQAMDSYGWMEFHDDGSFVATVMGDRELEPSEEESAEETVREVVGDFYDTRLTAEVVARLEAYGLLAELFDVSGEILVEVGIHSLGLPASISVGPERSSPNFTQILRTPVNTRHSADVEDLIGVDRVLRVAAPLLDDLMTAFSWPRNFQLDRNGAIRINFWGGPWVEQIRQWATQLELLISEER
jgi:hypothetical protein